MCERLQSIGRHLCPKVQLKTPIHVTVTGGAGNIGYSLAFMIGQGRLFGPEQPVVLTLLEVPQVKQSLEGVVMELNDASLPLLAEVRGVTCYKAGFTGCQVAILVGAKPRGPGMERKDLLGQNALIFKGQGEAINLYADRNCKVLVVGNPANTNAMICSYFAPNIPPQNFTALTRLDLNRANAQISERLHTSVRNIKNIIIWGNHSTTQYPDISYGVVENYPTQGVSTSLLGAVSDDKWVQSEFVSKVAKRGAEIIAARKLSSAASAASSICDHIHDWLVGTQPGQYASMGVISDGTYNVPRGICFSYPVTCKNGKWEIVQGLKWSQFSDKMIQTTTKELLEEKFMALEYLDNQKK